MLALFTIAAALSRFVGAGGALSFALALVTQSVVLLNSPPRVPLWLCFVARFCRGLSLCFCCLSLRWCIRDNLRDFVLFHQHVSKVGFHFEHVVFVRHDYAVQFLSIFQANLVGTAGGRGKAGREQREQA